MELFLDWSGVATIEPLQGIAALTNVDLADSMLAQQWRIRTSLVPPTPPPHPLSQHIPLHHSFQIQAPASPPSPTRQAVTPEERWGADLWILLRICNSSTALQFPDIWRTVAPLEKDGAHSTMEAAYKRTAESLRFRPPRIPHAVVVMVMELTFHTKDPYRVEDALNIYFLPTSPHQ